MKEESINITRYIPGKKTGHYESYFLRANHPNLPFAFWIRYTIFSPQNNPEKAIGELWAIFFDGTTGNHITCKSEIPMANCHFEKNKFHLLFNNSVLNEGYSSGAAENGMDKISWNLNYSGNSNPLFTLPQKFYDGKFPKAKLLVGMPLAVFNGTLTINEKNVQINNWIGSQNHNWGVKHTDNYAWGQVAGFDNSPQTFFEISTARLKYGPLWTPFLTLMVLRLNDKEYRLNTIFRALKAKGKIDNSTWDFSSENDEVKLEGKIFAPKNAFVELKYYNPPGGIKKCLNSKIASCSLRVKLKDNNGKFTEENLNTKNRAAFEILS